MSFSEWRKVKIKDVTTKIGSGSTPRGGSSIYQESGTAFVRSQNIYNNYFDYSGLVYIDDAAADKLKGVTLYPNDVLINITGDSVARCTVVPQQVLPARVNQHVCIIRADEKNLDYRFLKYALVNPPMQEIMLSYAQTGGTRAALTKSMIEEFEINLPSLQEQKVIANILSSLDEKIELNNQMNKTLEETAQALFKRWFIDFEFPNEDGEPYKSSGGEMVDSELGVIPKGWEIMEFKNMVKQVKPGTNYQPKRLGEGIPFLNVKNINTGYIDLEGAKFISEDDYNKVHKTWKPEKGDILISRIGTLGLVALIREQDLPIAVHYNFIDIKVDDKKRGYFYFLLKSDYFQSKYHSIKKASVQEYVTIDEVEKLKIIGQKNSSLEMKFNVLLEKVLETQKENEYLTIIRNTLLPKFMSGEIRVTDLQN